MLVLELSKWVGTREPTRLITGLSRVRLKFFYKFQYGLIFDPAHLEPVVSRIGSPTRR